MVAGNEVVDLGTEAPAWVSPVSFWEPTRVVASAWLEHAPFMFWLVSALRPKTFVELGTHNGFSFFTACEAGARLGIPMRSFAIDTWQGDDHAGFYGDDIYNDVLAVKERLYDETAVLCRGYFADFVADFDDGAVDLLHIDGRHGYDDVREDFESWLPKVSSSGIVIFHDVAVIREGFGVRQFWSELREQYPSFSFEHCNGLGVISVGSVPPPALKELFSANDEEAARIRSFYAARGKVVGEQFNLLSQFDMVSSLRSELEQSLSASQHESSLLRHDIEALRTSTSWKLTAPLRAVSERLQRSSSRP